MKLKFMGVGKCGIRIVYDFFALDHSLPSAFEIRAKHSNSVLKKFLSEDMQKKALDFRSKLHSMVKDLRLSESLTPHETLYVTVDSDSENNEVVNEIVVTGGSGDVTGERSIVFPGRNYDLNGHKGGCDFHVVSEHLAESWSGVPNEIVDASDVDIMAASFSIGGGTGGGAGSALLQRAKNAHASDRSCHFMGIGVLPKSDETYGIEGSIRAVATYEKFNAGRFFSSHYGGRNDIDSLWLISNDILGFLVETNARSELEKEGGELNLNLSLVNEYIGQCMAALINSSSIVTSAEENADSRELNNKLEGKPFISAFATIELGSGDKTTPLHSVKELLKAAFSNPHQTIDSLQGLSVPMDRRPLEYLADVLSGPEDDNEFMSRIKEYDRKKGPIELESAKRVIVFYGQPSEHYSAYKKDRIESACSTLVGGHAVFYSYRHNHSRDTLLVLIVDPFILPVISSIYYYANEAWVKSDQNLRETYDSVVGSSEFDSSVISQSFTSNELLPDVIYGDGVHNIEQSFEDLPDLAIKKEQMIHTFEYLHDVYNRKPVDIETRSSLGRRDS